MSTTDSMPPVTASSVQTEPSRRSGLLWLGVPLAILAIAVLILARFTAALPSNASTSPMGSLALPKATPFGFAPSTPANTISTQGGAVVAGATPLAIPLVSGYPNPSLDTAAEQQLRADAGNPDKIIMVSIQGQFIQAFDHGTLVRWDYVTTGRPGMETPTGFFNIGWKLTPFTFEPISTDPKSPYFGYPSKVQYAMEFAAGGYFIHDTWWRTIYGPPLTTWHWDPGRGEYQEGSHGCVNTPLEMMTYLFTWAPVGTTVIVF